MSKQKSSVRESLETPFREDQIKSRPGNFGQQLAYVEGHAVIKRLNEALESSWSFEIIVHRVLESEVLVLGKLTCELGTKMAFGGSLVTHAKETGEVVSLVGDLKAASTDAIKKCATLLGVGLHLYDANNKPSSKPATVGTPKNGWARLTARQLAAIYAIAKSKSLDKDDVQRLSVRDFDRMPDFLTKSQASDMIQALQNDVPF